MAFVQSFTATQDPTGLSILITDTSNWLANSLDPANFVRQFVIKDSDDNTINTYQMPTNSNVLSYPIAINQWQSITFNITGAFSASLMQKYPFEQLYRLAYVKAITASCGCCNDNDSFCDVDAFYQGAQFAIPIGDGVSYDTNITSAYTLLTT